jgi:hypothetical protein
MRRQHASTRDARGAVASRQGSLLDARSTAVDAILVQHHGRVTPGVLPIRRGPSHSMAVSADKHRGDSAGTGLAEGDGGARGGRVFERLRVATCATASSSFQLARATVECGHANVATGMSTPRFDGRENMMKVRHQLTKRYQSCGCLD